MNWNFERDISKWILYMYLRLLSAFERRGPFPPCGWRFWLTPRLLSVWWTRRHTASPLSSRSETTMVNRHHPRWLVLLIRFKMIRFSIYLLRSTLSPNLVIFVRLMVRCHMFTSFFYFLHLIVVCWMFKVLTWIIFYFRSIIFPVIKDRANVF